MIKVVLAVACLVLSAGALHAGGVDDLKAAQAAAASGNGDEAIRLFTQGLNANDLSPADQVAARKGRGTEYTSKSLIADAFVRLDQARNFRADAIADFTAALKDKPDDAGLYLARGEAYHLNGQFAPAIADFDAALKLNNNAITLIHRAASLRANGDTERAVADFSAAIDLGAKESGVDSWEIYSERGYTQFLGARYDAAAADFEKALTLGGDSHDGDVLWLPYQAAWLHIARARAGQDDAAELARNAAKMDLKRWPGTLMAFYLGQVKQDQLSPPSSHGAMGRGRECNMAFFTGEHALITKDSAQAALLFQRARAACNIHSVIYLAAGVELKRLGK